MKCERCGKPGADVCGEACLCETCVSLIIREWRIRHDEFGELQASRLDYSKMLQKPLTPCDRCTDAAEFWFDQEFSLCLQCLLTILQEWRERWDDDF